MRAIHHLCLLIVFGLGLYLYSGEMRSMADEIEMKTFKSFDGLEIAYLDEGTGPAVLLVHGYASSVEHNWLGSGLFAAVRDAGFRAIAIDLRGHGASDKPHARAPYENLALTKDCVALLDHLQISEAHLVGYSMGSTIIGWTALTDDRAKSLVISGHGDTISLPKWEGADHVAEGLMAETDEGLDETQIAYRRFIEARGGDKIALARVAQTDEGIPADRLSEIKQPVLILTGIDDDLVGPVDGLAAALPNATVNRPPGDHLTAPLQPEFKDALIGFLKAQ